MDLVGAAPSGDRRPQEPRRRQGRGQNRAGRPSASSSASRRRSTGSAGRRDAMQAWAIEMRRNRVPSPLVGEGEGGGRAGFCSLRAVPRKKSRGQRDPPPQPSPTRGEGSEGGSLRMTASAVDTARAVACDPPVRAVRMDGGVPILARPQRAEVDLGDRRLLLPRHRARRRGADRRHVGDERLPP